MWGEILLAGSDSGAINQYWADGEERFQLCGQSAQQDDMLDVTRQALAIANSQRTSALSELRQIRARLDALEDIIYKGSNRRRQLQKQKLEVRRQCERASAFRQ